MSDLLEHLNEEQRIAVEDTNGYKLVLAGAGSGKTRVLTYAIAYLLDKGLASSENIFATTFTNKAANEMKERIGHLIPNAKNQKWWIGTFHGLCVRLLLRYGREVDVPPYFTIADEKEQKSLARQVCRDTQYEPSQLMYKIADAKNNLRYPAHYLGSTEEAERDFATLYQQYQDILRGTYTLDFDDLIMKTVELMRVSEEARDNIQSQFKYVLIDESQDLNLAQYELALLIAGKHKNLTLVGDSDQGIYSWRGANIDIIRNFAQIEGTKTMQLVQNYRSTKIILEAANQVIKNNKDRIDKNLMTENEMGENLITFTADTDYQEAAFIADTINYYCNTVRDYSYDDIAVLYRTNNQSNFIESALLQRYIPHTVVNGIGFFERKEVKDIVAYIRLIFNEHDVLAFQRIANEPKRGVGETTLQKITDFIIENSLTVYEAIDRLDEIPKLTKKSKEALTEFKEMMTERMNKVNEVTPGRFIKELGTASGYFEMLDESEQQDRVENVYTLADMADFAYESMGITLLDYIKEISLFSDIDQAEEQRGVKLMTVHTAKGLEFPVVFIAGMEENIFPHYLSLVGEDPAELEEERRSFYVAITRAQKRLFLTSAMKRGSFGKVIANKRSRFLSEIPEMFIKRM